MNAEHTGIVDGAAVLRALPHKAEQAPQIDIVVPVYNEEAVLEYTVRRLHRFLSAELPVHLADRDRRQREHRRHAGDRPARWPASCAA